MSLQQISLFLIQYPDPVFLVGGSVRHCLLGKSPDDIDIVVSQRAIQLAQKLARKFQLKWIVLDSERDMARVFLSDMALDIAAYGHSLEDDLKLRDLTINAIACPVSVPWTDRVCVLSKEQLIDPCQGLNDLKDALLRGISFANFESDPLRLLRLFRFAATLGFQIEAQTLEWVHVLKANLLLSASERILLELNKLLSTSQAAKTLGLMADTGLAQVVFRQETSILRVNIEKVNQLEIFWCEIKKIDFLLSYFYAHLADTRQVLFFLKLAILIRPEHGQFAAAALKSSFALSRAEIECLTLWEQLLVLLKSIFESKSPVDIMRFFRLGKQHTLGALLLFYLDYQQSFTAQDEHLWWSLLKAWGDRQHALAHPVDLLDGKDIMRELQIHSGPQVGRILERIQAEQALGLIQSRQAALDYLRCLSADDF